MSQWGERTSPSQRGNKRTSRPARPKPRSNLRSCTLTMCAFRVVPIGAFDLAQTRFQGRRIVSLVATPIGVSRSCRNLPFTPLSNEEEMMQRTVCYSAIVALSFCHPNFCRPFQCCSSKKQSRGGTVRQRTHKTVRQCASERKQHARMSPKGPRKTSERMRCIGEQCCTHV